MIRSSRDVGDEDAGTFWTPSVKVRVETWVWKLRKEDLRNCITCTCETGLLDLISLCGTGVSRGCMGQAGKTWGC